MLAYVPKEIVYAKTLSWKFRYFALCIPYNIEVFYFVVVMLNFVSHFNHETYHNKQALIMKNGLII